MFIFIFFLSLYSYADEKIQCPQESTLLEYNAPGSSKIIKTCAYVKDSSVIRHGPELVFSNGKVDSSHYYTHGNLSDAPLVEKVDLNHEVEQSFEALIQLLSILTNDQGRMNHGKFNVGKCDKKPSDWSYGAISKNDIPKNYSFDEKCDVTGRFIASFKNAFPVTFLIRNLQVFSKTAMLVKMETGRGAKGFRYMFEVSNGLLKGNQITVKFSAKYEVDINPTNGHAIFPTQDGVVSITEINGRPISVSRKLNF